MTTPRWRQPEFVADVKARVSTDQFERFKKMYHEPFFLINSELTHRRGARTFTVSGSTQSTYNVTIHPNGSTWPLSIRLDASLSPQHWRNCFSSMLIAKRATTPRDRNISMAATTVAWFLWNNVSDCKVTWIQSIIICATIIGCCRSATRMPSSDE